MTKDPPGAAAPIGGDAALRQRVEQLEEQLVDLQVVIGTLESLAKAPAGAASASPAYRTPAPSANNAGDAGRLDGMETQIRALTQQLEQLSAEVRGGAPGRNAAAQVPAATGAMRPDAATVPQGTGREFGATSVTPAPADGIGSLIGEPAAAATQQAGTQVAATGPSGDDAKLAYEAAYGHMLQQDYGAAQAGFGDFLKHFPRHALTPNAIYWLGETYYVQRNYADAAEAFDIVLTAHAASNKAPDSQLKKAMSLSQQGKNAESCTALRVLASKYPDAPAHVKTKADSERRRIGCT